MAYGHIAYVGEGTTPFTMDNPTVIMTVDNIVMFCSDIQHVTGSADTIIYVLPDSSLYPKVRIRMYVPAKDEVTNTVSQKLITIGNAGNIRINSSATNQTTFYLNGITFNVNDNYYSSAIGNNDMSLMTTPISAR